MQYSVREHLKERRAHGAWKKDLDERPLPPLAVQAMIRDGKVKACKFHDAMPSVGVCDRCGNAMCTACYKRGICRDCIDDRLARAFKEPPRRAALNSFRRKEIKFLYLVLLPLFILAATTFVPFSPLTYDWRVLLFFVVMPFLVIGLEVWFRLLLARIKEMQGKRA